VPQTRTSPLIALVATSLAAFTATLDNTVVAVALRDMQADLGSGVLGLQGIVTAYTVALAALLLAGGALVDVLGARRVLLLGTLVFAASSAACAASGSVGWLVAWRAVQGAGAALLLPGGLAVLAQANPDPVRRRRAVGVWAAVSGAALVAGPAVGGELVARHGWPSVFWVNVPLCALVLALLTPLPRRSTSFGASASGQGPDLTKIAAEAGSIFVRSGQVQPGVARADEDRRGLDLGGAALSCLVLGAGAYGVVLGGRHGLSWQAALPLAVALAGAGALRQVERRREDPLLPADLLRARRFRGALLAAFAAALAVFVLMVFVSLFLQVVLGHGPRQAGGVLLALPVALVLTAALSSWWHAVLVPVLAGLVLAGIGLIGLAAAVDVTVSDATVRTWLALVGAGVGLTTAPVVTTTLATTLATAGPRREGLASASITVARELGGVVAVAGLGALAVARLTSSLTGILVSLGVPSPDRQPMLDALLRADRPDVRRQLIDAVGVERALGAAQRFQDAATASFATSTRWVLGSAGLALLVLAVASAWMLGSDHRGEGVEER
jgi:DHA2 family methylenomycin A resistance protein-like MFS transporter